MTYLKRLLANLDFGREIANAYGYNDHERQIAEQYAERPKEPEKLVGVSVQRAYQAAKRGLAGMYDKRTAISVEIERLTEELRQTEKVIKVTEMTVKELIDGEPYMKDVPARADNGANIKTKHDNIVGLTDADLIESLRHDG